MSRDSELEYDQKYTNLIGLPVVKLIFYKWRHLPLMRMADDLYGYRVDFSEEELTSSNITAVPVATKNSIELFLPESSE